MDSEKETNTERTGLIALLIFLLILSIIMTGWLVTCGLIKLITIGLGCKFSWSVATVIYILLCVFIEVLSCGATENQ